MPKRPKILVFDSGLGGLTVFSALCALRPDADYTYVADDAAFPYGPLAGDVLIARVMVVMEQMIARVQPDCVVIACNTASTLVLGPLRARWPDLPFVGTVPAIKPAAGQTRSGLFSVLATPGTVARDYTHDLVRQFAGQCRVNLVGSKALASLAERFMQGEPVADADLRREIMPAFVDEARQKTDVIVLACTHYPLLLEQFTRLAPWPVTWIDSGPAIARRTDHVLREKGLLPESTAGSGASFMLTSGHQPADVLWKALQGRGFTHWLEGSV